MELLVVILIIGIIAAVSLPNFIRSREAVYDREAQANLKLIIAAERAFKIEQGNYTAEASNAGINNNLSLYLRVSDPKWNYSATRGGGSTLCAQATRNGEGNRNWRLRVTEQNPVNTTCP